MTTTSMHPGAPVDVEEKPTDEAGVDDSRLMDHAYDGIREYDNPLPGWWSAAFIITIVFAVMYGFYFHVANWGQTPDQKYQAALAEWGDKKSIRDRAEAANVNEAALARNASDPKMVEAGAAVFNTKCITCHAAGGTGQIGPNLTDSYQIHGTTRLDIFHTIHDGAPGTAMIAWGDQLAAGDILAAAAYVTSLRNTNKPGKAPQGEPVGAFQP